jgi:N4-gp56 family major capsid protein
MAINAASAVTNANLSNTVATYYDSVAVDALYANLAFQTLTTPRDLPLHKGKTIQLFTYPLTPFVSGVTAGSNPTQGTEGAVGNGLVPTAPSVQATIGQYFDYITVSDLALDAAIDPMLENLSKVMGYRAALVTDTIVQMELDAITTIDPSTTNDLADGTYMTAGVIRSAAASLFGRNVRPFDDGKLHGILHPFVAGDIFNDTTYNGITDILKRTEKGVELLQEGWGEAANYEVLDFAGIKFVQSTNVPLTSGVPTTGKSAYSCYIAGKDAIFSIKLGGQDVPEGQNFKAAVKQFESNQADPAGVIKGGVSFNFKYVAAPRPGTGSGSQAIWRRRCESQNS